MIEKEYLQKRNWSKIYNIIFKDINDFEMKNLYTIGFNNEFNKLKINKEVFLLKQRFLLAEYRILRSLFGSTLLNYGLQSIDDTTRLKQAISEITKEKKRSEKLVLLVDARLEDVLLKEGYIKIREEKKIEIGTEIGNYKDYVKIDDRLGIDVYRYTSHIISKAYECAGFILKFFHNKSPIQLSLSKTMKLEANLNMDKSCNIDTDMYIFAEKVDFDVKRVYSLYY